MSRSIALCLAISAFQSAFAGPNAPLGSLETAQSRKFGTTLDSGAVPALQKAIGSASVGAVGARRIGNVEISPAVDLGRTIRLEALDARKEDSRTQIDGSVPAAGSVSSNGTGVAASGSQSESGSSTQTAEAPGKSGGETTTAAKDKPQPSVANCM